MFSPSSSHTMNEQMIHTVVAINNQCIEQFHNGNLVSALSELLGAMSLLNQSVTVIYPTPSALRLSCVSGVQHRPSSSSPPQISQGIPNNHRLHQQSPAILMNVQLKFYLEEPTSNGIASTSSPIVPFFPFVRMVYVDNMNDRPYSLTEQQ